MSKAAFAVLAVLSITGCSQEAEVRYRLHVIADDNGSERVGDGVWSVRLSKVGLPWGSSYSGGVQADAIPVPLPGRGVLLVLPAGASERNGDVASLLPERAFGGGLTPSFGGRLAMLRRLAETKTEAVPLSCDYTVDNKPTDYGAKGIPELQKSGECLKLAYTDKPADPRRMHLSGVLDGLHAPLGVSIKKITIQVVRDPVNRDLDQVLPWLSAEPFKKSGLYVAGSNEPGIDWYAQFLRRTK